MAQQTYPYQDLKLENIHTEEWVDVKDYEGIYMISNFGRVKTFNRGGAMGMIMKQGKQKLDRSDKSGITKRYQLFIILYKFGGQKNCTIMKLVAEHFMKDFTKADNEMYYHKDKDAFNNHISNIGKGTYNFSKTLDHKIHSHKRNHKLIEASIKYHKARAQDYISTDVKTGKVVILKHADIKKIYGKNAIPHINRVARKADKKHTAYGKTWQIIHPLKINIT